MNEHIAENCECFKFCNYDISIFVNTVWCKTYGSDPRNFYFYGLLNIILIIDISMKYVDFVI